MRYDKLLILVILISCPLLVWGQPPATGLQQQPTAGTKSGQPQSLQTVPPRSAARETPVPNALANVPAQSSPVAGTSQGSVRLPVASPSEAQNGNQGQVAATEEKEAAKGKAVATAETQAGGEEKVYLNVQDQDIKDVIKQISKATGKNFIIDDKVRGKVTIMSEKMMTKEEAYQAFLSALEVAGFTTVTGPGGIIKIVGLKEAVSSPIPIHVDSTPYTDSYVTRLIPLKNISALDMSNAIKGLISKSGNMFAYPATNTLIITDSGTNIDRLMKIIKELDQEGPQQVLEIIPINFADAKDVAQKVLSLFEIEQKGAVGGAKKGGGAELEEIKDVSKIIADERTNSLIVLASKRAIDKVRDIIAKLDVPLKTGDTGMIHVHYLKYANAADIAQTLSAVTAGAKSSATGAKTGVGERPGEKGKEGAAKSAPVVAQLEGGISIGADETTNALIITASAKDYQLLVDELISKLDIPRRQVYLEAIVMELSVTKGNRAGVSGYGGAGNNTVLGFGSVSGPNMNVLNGLFDPRSLFAMPGMLGGLLARDTVSINVPQAGGGTTQLTIPSFAAFLNLLQTYNDFNIVSTPNILTVDNEKASIEVTKKRYIPTTTTVATAGSVLAGSTPVEAGLTLEVTPQITEGDAVRLEIHHKLSNFTGEAQGNIGPPETKREISTTVVAMDGQTVVLGGLMEDQVQHTKSKVPILGDIPLLGLLFRQSSSTSDKSNLLVFITPHVIKDPSDFADISKMKIEQRNNFIENNYGKRQQRSIRDTIATHRADLLEYTPPPTAASSYSGSPQGSYSPGASPQGIQSKADKKAESAPALPAKTPVITVSPVGPGSVSKTREAGELDTAY